MNIQIAVATDEQHQVAEDINQNIQKVHDDTVQLNDVASRARTNAKGMSDAAESPNQMVVKFKAD